MVPASQESCTPKDQILSAPMRFVRTNKAKETGQLQAKSRLIIPGHRDPQLGLYRTDAPTTSGLAVMVVATIAAAQGWLIRFFDVMTAFLSGKEIGRTVYTRGPPDGLPSVNGRPAVKPYQLMQVLKGAYGLTESPRLFGICELGSCWWKLVLLSFAVREPCPSCRTRGGQWRC